jgi:prepilin-type N-terminal cleavage/methylation domain-containing protein
MNTMNNVNFTKSNGVLEGLHAERGFTLVELIIAMAVFMIIGGAAFTLFGRAAGISAEQQTFSGINIGMRNAMTQMEMDMAGAGGNLLAGTTAQPFYFSVIVRNSLPGVAPACTPNTTTWAYPTTSACYDSLTVLSPNDSLAKPCAGAPTPPLALSVAANVSAATTLTANDASNTANNTTDAACFKNGDEILLVQPAVSGNCDVSGVTVNYCMNVTTLTHDATVAGTISLQVAATGSTTSDPLGIVYQASGVNFFADALANHFPINSSYVVDLGTGSTAMTYAIMVNPSNAADPQLVRCPGTSCTTANASVVADQIIGFKVGADLWNNKLSGATDIANYIYNGANYCSDAITGTDCTVTPPANYDPYDFTLVRAVRVSIVGRTVPRTDRTVNTYFLNGYDSGPYLVQQASTIVDLRNLSNVDSTD